MRTRRPARASTFGARSGLTPDRGHRAPEETRRRLTTARTVRVPRDGVGKAPGCPARAFSGEGRVRARCASWRACGARACPGDPRAEALPRLRGLAARRHRDVSAPRSHGAGSGEELLPLSGRQHPEPLGPSGHAVREALRPAPAPRPARVTELPARLAVGPQAVLRRLLAVEGVQGLGLAAARALLGRRRHPNSYRRAQHPDGSATGGPRGLGGPRDSHTRSRGYGGGTAGAYIPFSLLRMSSESSHGQ